MRSVLRFLGGVVSGCVLWGLLAMPAKAGPLFLLKETTVDTTWREDDQFRKTYSMITWENISWVQLETAVKIYDNDQPGLNYTIQNEISFPEQMITGNLHFEWKVTVADKYHLDKVGADYQITILPNWKIAFSAGMNSRIPKESLSFYQQSLQEVATELQINPFKYYLSLKHEDKEDEESDYTHQTWQLYQSLFWEVNRSLDIELFYHEKTGNYPYQISKNDWSQQWRLKGTHQWKGTSGGRTGFFWSYATANSTRGYSIPGHDQEYKVGGDYQITPVSVGSLYLEGNNHESFYVNPELADPDEIITDNQKSYRDTKLTWEYRHRGRHISWNFGYLIERKDFYQSDGAGGVSPGYFGSISWKWQQVSLLVRLSQAGTFGERQTKYQLSIDYKP